MLIRCTTKSQFKDSMPRDDVAVIGILNRSEERIAVENWGPAIFLRFEDVMFDVARFGGTESAAAARSKGYFSADQAQRVRRFLSCDVVEQSREVVVFSESGPASAMAVALYAHGRLGGCMEIGFDSTVNESVAQMLNADKRAKKNEQIKRVSAMRWLRVWWAGLWGPSKEMMKSSQ